MANRFLSELNRRGVIQTLTAYVVSSWLIIEVFDIAVPLFAFPSWVTSLIGVVLLAGFPVAAYLSWFFNYSNGRFQRAVEVTGGASQPLSIWHWMGLGVITVAAAGAGTVFYEDVSDRLRKDEEGVAEADLDETVAIIPFEDLSPSRDQGFLAEGIAAEVASLLGRIDGVQTAATTASFRLARAGIPTLEIGQRLSMATVLSGSVSVSGSRLRVRAELLATKDGELLWTESFTRTFNDVFALEEEVARSIANVLSDQYVDSDEVSFASRTASSDAYVFYLKGRAEFRRRTAEGVKAARTFFEQSVALDSEYAPAHVGVADTMGALADGGEQFGTLDPKVASAVAKQSIERALLLDDSLPEAYATLGRAEALAQNFEASLAHYDKAISLNESLFDVHVWRLISLNKLGRYAEAMEAIRRAEELDPTAPTVLHNIGLELAKRGDFDGARAYFERLIELEPDSPLGFRGLASAAFRAGDLALSLENWAQALRLSPETPTYAQSYRDTLNGLRMVEVLRPLALQAGEEVNVLLLEEDFDALEEKMNFAMAANPDDPWLKFEAGWYRYLAKDFAGGDELMLAADTGFNDADRFLMPMCSPAIEVALALRNTGELEKANQYIARCEEELDVAEQSVFKDNFIDHLAARIAALTGDSDSSIAYMERAYEHGWREWWTELDPVLSDVKADPEMRKLFARIESDLDRQRAIASMNLDAQSVSASK